MRVSQFTVGSSRTINLGNFESLRVEAQVIIQLDEGEVVDIEQREGAQAILRDLLADTYRKMTAKKQEQIT